MQARAIFEAAVYVANKGVKVYPEIMIPPVATLKEMADQGVIVRRVAEEVFKEKGTRIDYLVGTMIELPSAALVADEIAKEAEFFCFGTNNLPLVKMATERGRKTRPTLRVGICGGRGGDPPSMEFCHQFTTVDNTTLFFLNMLNSVAAADPAASPSFPGAL